MMRKLAPVIILSFVAACTSESKTESALKNAGYTDIEVGGWAVAACSDDDMYSTKFRATAPNGSRGSGVVCCGLLTKACTVRFGR